MSESLPFLCSASPGLILCKDGSLLAGFEYSGVDIDNVDPFLLEQCLRELQASYQSLDERFYAWWCIDKQRDRDFPQSEFPNAAGQRIDDLQRARYERGEMFSIRYRFYLLYTGETGVFAYMENVKRLINDEGRPLPMALLLGLNPEQMQSSAVLHDARQMDANVQMTEDAIAKFTSVSSVMHFKRLVGWDLESALVQQSNITLPLSSHYEPPPGCLLDGYASLSDVNVGREVVAVSGPSRTAFVANLALQQYPGKNNPLLLEKLMSLPCEFRLTHVMKLMGQRESRKELGEAIEHYQFAQSSLAQRFVAYLSGKPPAIDPGKDVLYAQCVEASSRQMSEDLGWVKHAMTISLIEDSVPQLERRVREIARELNQFTFIRERLGLKASFWAMVPGQWAHQRRLQLVNTEVAADCSPVFTISPGSPVCEFLAGEVYKGKPVPTLSSFRTIYGTRYNFDPYVGQVGHGLVVMPTGGGKTTFVNYCLSQFQRYPNAQIIIFDRNHSCRIITGLHEGTHIDLNSGNVKLNPMAAIREGAMGILWAREFVIQLLQEGGYATTAEDRNAIDHACTILARSDQVLSLSKLAITLPNHLKANLAEWLSEGPYGMFDNETDDFNLTSWTCIEMKEILSVERLSRAFLDHAFRQIEKRLDGRPTFIYLEEASFLLNNKAFLPRLDDWLKTFRKKIAFVWMSVQSPESVSGIDDEKIKATLADNVPNLLLGFNNRLENHRELYKSMFAMTDAQVDILRDITPKRDYLLMSTDSCRIMRTQFDKESLAYLRSEPSFQAMLDAAQKSGDANWRQRYVEDVMRRSN
ncbi:VirB4 family type IV secretion system protein [Variovorax gossypii]